MLTTCALRVELSCTRQQYSRNTTLSVLDAPRRHKPSRIPTNRFRLCRTCDPRLFSVHWIGRKATPERESCVLSHSSTMKQCLFFHSLVGETRVTHKFLWCKSVLVVDLSLLFHVGRTCDNFRMSGVAKNHRKMFLRLLREVHTSKLVFSLACSRFFIGNLNALAAF